MNGFQTTVLAIAVVVLILIFIIFAILMSAGSTTIIYPPGSLPCPNYWQQTADGKCAIPLKDTTNPNIIPVNVGTFDVATITTNNSGTPNYIAGLDTTAKTIDFNDKSWGSGNSSATCDKQAWAKKYGVLWDGVSNYNGCS